jgi:NAD(P)-dependent dehydrogenase (short-subunit alcohol dehydrogenase family)
VDLRYRLAVVTGAGGGLGRDVAVALARVGAAVLCVDPDLAAARETSSLVQAARVRSWPLEADLGEAADVRMVAARARDLGGADLLVTTDGTAGGGRLADLVTTDLPLRRGRRDGTPGVVRVGPPSLRTSGTAAAEVRLAEVRLMAVETVGARVPAEVVRAVVDLLSHGADGDVVVLGPAGPTTPRGVATGWIPSYDVVADRSDERAPGGPP